MTRPKNSVVLDAIHPGVLPFLADHFRSARREQDFSLAELVREAGYSHRKLGRGVARLRHLESGDRPSPRQFTIRQFAHTLGIDIDELCDRLYAREQELREARRDNGPPRFLGAMLRRARSQLGLSIPDLVEQLELYSADCGITRIERLEFGEFRFPSESELLALATPLHIPPAQLLQAVRKEAEQFDRRGEPAWLNRQVSPIFSRPRTEEHQGERSILEFLRYADTLAADKQCTVAVFVEDHPTIYIAPGGDIRRRIEAKGCTLTTNWPI